jgi:hypothetical protein
VHALVSMKGTSTSSVYFWNSQVEAIMIQAMAEYRLNQIEQARSTFRAGMELADQKLIKPGQDLTGQWDGWLLAHFLMRETAKLMPEVISSNDTFAGILAEKPAWQVALDKARVKYTGTMQADGTWQINLNDQPVSDLSFLQGVSVSKLSLNHTSVADLSPLESMPLLKALLLSGTKVTDLSPLHDLLLTQLNISRTSVSDLSPIHDMALTDLRMATCPNLTNLDAIREMYTLQTLELPESAKDIQFLRKFPNLKRIGYKYDPAVKGPDKTRDEFWAEYDKTQGKSVPTSLP